jgi:maleylpyruvate isomerase
MSSDPTPGAALDALHHSEQRLLRTVDSLSGSDWSAPSVLPGWTRAHVVAHLALNAEALAGAVDGLAHELDVPVYESDQRRDEDIAELAAADPAAVRDRLFGAGQLLRDALESLDPPQWQRSISRLPGGPLWAMATVPGTRRREVEIHHADLDAGYAPANWPADFAVDLLDVVTGDHAASPESPAFGVRATDTGGTWDVGAERPVVEGTAAELGWWLVGRGNGEGLSCDAGELPRLGPWRRTPAPTPET